MSNTPRTDAAEEWNADAETWVVPTDFARQLERENAKLREALEKFVAWCDRNDWGTVPKSLEAKVRSALSTTESA